MTEQETYVVELKRLAALCRTLAESEADHPAPDDSAVATRLEALEAEVAELRASRQVAADANDLLQRRIAAIEKSLPPPQFWRDLIRGIGAVRETVGQLQHTREENATCRPA